MNKKNYFFFIFIVIGIILTVSYKNYLNKNYGSLLFSAEYDPFLVKEENLDHFNNDIFEFPKSILPSSIVIILYRNCLLF